MIPVEGGISGGNVGPEYRSGCTGKN